MDYKMKTILESVCSIAGISEDEIRGRNKARHLSDPRRVYVNILFGEGGYTCMRVGQSINRDHATVLHHRRTHPDLYRLNRDYKLLYDACLNKYLDEINDVKEITKDVDPEMKINLDNKLRIKIKDLKAKILEIKEENKARIKELENKNKDLDYKILKLQKQNKMNYYSIR